jgi:hypothetical protein
MLAKVQVEAEVKLAQKTDVYTKTRLKTLAVFLVVNLRKTSIMEKLEFITKSEGGKVVLDIPAKLDGKKLKVVVTEDHDDLNDDELKRFHELSDEERLRILQQFAGSAKYPDFPINKYDVYDQ